MRGMRLHSLQTAIVLDDASAEMTFAKQHQPDITSHFTLYVHKYI